MDEKPLTPFDELITPPTLQMLKLFIPYIPSNQQKTLAVYEKYLELKFTFDFYQKNQNTIHMQSMDTKPLSFTALIEKISPYLGENEQGMLESISNAMNMMEMFQEFQEMESEADERMDEQSPSEEYESEETTIN
ncbi:MAG: hypothetical protein PHW34_00170 [Hespellia sp.]|nr:hypothetical protein [Hespellia sp.]